MFETLLRDEKEPQVSIKCFFKINYQGSKYNTFSLLNQLMFLLYCFQFVKIFIFS